MNLKYQFKVLFSVFRAVSKMEEIEELKRQVVTKLNDLVRYLQVTATSDSSFVLEEVTELQKCIFFLDSISRVPDGVISVLSRVRVQLQADMHCQQKPPTVNVNRQGRPKFDITAEQMRLLLAAHFTVPGIASLLHVSTRTIERRVQEFGLSARQRYTDIQDERLDMIVTEIKEVNPNCGSKMLTGYLRSRGIIIQRERIRDSLSRVDPIGIASRRCHAVHRRTYKVSRP